MFINMTLIELKNFWIIVNCFKVILLDLSTYIFFNYNYRFLVSKSVTPSRIYNIEILIIGNPLAYI